MDAQLASDDLGGTGGGVHAELCDGLALALASDDPALALPEPLLEQARHRATIFKADHFRGFDPDSYGPLVADRRRANVGRQLERLKDPNVVAHARKAWTAMYTAFLRRIEKADDVRGIETRFPTEPDFWCLLRPLLARLAYPPGHTDVVLKFRDLSVASHRLLDKYKVLDAWTAGTAVPVDLHFCGAHSAKKKDSSFPSTANWDKHGCSSEHHAAFLELQDSVEAYRRANTFGETINVGYSHVKPWADAFHPTSTPSVTLPRIYHPADEYADCALPAAVDYRLSFALSLSRPGLVPPTSPTYDAVTEFTYLTQLTSHVSLGYYVPAERDSLTLGRVHATERAFLEIAELAGQVPEQRDLYPATRAYLARCKGGEGKSWTFPPVVQWAWRTLRREPASRRFGDSEVAFRIGKPGCEELSRLASAWRATERERIGAQPPPVGLLEEACSGFFAIVVAKHSTLFYPSLSSPDALLSVPASTSDVRLAVDSHQQHASAVRNGLVYPSLASADALLSVPASTSDVRLAVDSHQQHARAGNDGLVYPSLASADALLPVPASTSDVRFAVDSHTQHASAGEDGLVYPSLASADALLSVPASTSDVRLAVDSHTQHASAGEDGLVYPSLSSPDALLSVPASTSDVRLAVDSHQQHARAGNDGLVYPSLSSPDALLSVPASTSDVRFAVDSHIQHASAGEDGLVYPSLASADALLSVPASTSDVRFAVDSHTQHASAGNDGLVYPSLPTSGLLLPVSASTSDLRFAIDSGQEHVWAGSDGHLRALQGPEKGLLRASTATSDLRMAMGANAEPKKGGKRRL